MSGAAMGLVLLLWLQDASPAARADALLAEKRYAEAAESYEALVRDHPDDPRIRVRLGASLMGLGRPAEAIPHLETAEKMVPRDPVVLRILGEAYLATGKLAEAARRFRGVLEITPGRPDVLVSLGACQYQLGDFDGAAASFRSAIEKQSRDARALAGLGMSLNALGRPGEARPVLERALGEAPTDRMARLALASSLTELGEFQRADELLRRLTEEDPKDAEAWQYLAALRFRNNYHEQALEAAERCLALRPDDRDARILRARSLVSLGRLPEAGPLFRELAADPGVAADWEFLLGSTEYSFYAGDLDTALARIADAISRRPQSGLLHSWRARILHQAGRTLEAQAEAERAVVLSPDLREPHGLLVRIYRELGMEAKAAEQIEWLSARPLAGQGRR
jgi:tetratricopeptide (TPR) repeat protein